jgi:hypothetical protein
MPFALLAAVLAMGPSRCSALALLRAAALAEMPSPRGGSEVCEQPHVEDPKSGQQSGEEQWSGV